jgi:hypothetical protein
MIFRLVLILKLSGMSNKCLFKFLKLLFFSLLFLLYSPFIFSSPLTNDYDNHDERKLSAEEIIRGERLFYGLIDKGKGAVNCAGCHNTNYIDTLNWNPDAYEISLKYLHKSADDLSATLLIPGGPKMLEVHKKMDFTPEDIVMIKGFMDVIALKGLTPPKPVINHLLLFIFAFVLILLALSDLIFFRKVKLKFIHLLIILGAAFFITQTMVKDAIAVGRSPGYEPDQPIKFSHAIHAGQNQTDCQYCHSSASFSKSAGIPSLNVCMNCHLIVRNGSHSGTFEIAKIIQAYENNEPVEWIRIHNLPDHAFFSHAQHVGVGKVECQKCHGEVETMDRVKLVNDLSMGWCINCHRETAVDLHSNEFYQNYEELAEKLKDGELDRISVESIGGIECMKCHY